MKIMKTKTRKKVEIIILISVIWFVITLPLPWIVASPPEGGQTQIVAFVQMVGMVSVPFVILGIVWTLKPELTT